MNDNKVIIYTANDGKTKIDVKLEEETLWLTQAQMCELYQTSKSNVSEHIKHIFEEEELNEVSVVRIPNNCCRRQAIPCFTLQSGYDN